jgi:hypothetical protein
MVMVAGDITTQTKIDNEKVVLGVVTKSDSIPTSTTCPASAARA